MKKDVIIHGSGPKNVPVATTSEYGDTVLPRLILTDSAVLYSLLLKRYRCPECGCVVCYRPWGYFSRFRAPVETIRSNISHRLRTGRWPCGFSRNRQGHWLRALQRRIIAYLGNNWQKSIMEAFDYFISQGQIPISRSI